MRQRILAIALLVAVALAGAVLMFGAKWQPKRMNGTGLGLYIAPGDSIVASAAKIDTAKHDTLMSVAALFTRLHAHHGDLTGLLDNDHPQYADTARDVVHDSLTAFAGTDTIGLRTAWQADVGDTADALRDEWREDISDSLAELVVGDTTGLRAEWRIDVGDTSNVLRDEWLEDISDSLAEFVGGDTTGLRDEWRVDIADSLAAFEGGGDMMAADVRDSILAAYADTLHSAVHDTADALRGEMGGGSVTSEDLHDTANVVRTEIVEAGSWNTFRRIISQAPGAYLQEADRYNNGSTVVGVWSEPGHVYAALGADGLLSFTVDAEGVMTLADSIGMPGGAGDVWGDGSRIFVPAGVWYDYGYQMTRMYSVAENGALAQVDSVLWGGSHWSSTVTGYSPWIYAVSRNNGDGYSHFMSYQVNPSDPDDLVDKGMSVYQATPLSTMTLEGTDLYAVDGTGDAALRGWYISNQYTGDLTAGSTYASPDTVMGVCANSMYVVAAMKNLGAMSFRRGANGTFTKRDSLSVGYSTTAIDCDETHVYIGTTDAAGSGFSAMSIDTAGHMIETDRINASQSSPTASRHALQWNGQFLYVGTSGYGLVEFICTDQGLPVYSIQARFADTTLVQGPVTIDVSEQPTVGTHDFTVKDGATPYSYVDAGDADWTASSSGALKMLDRPFTPTLGARVLKALSNLPIQNWYWRGGDGKQHVGPTAEDWYRVARLVAPKTADPSYTSGEHKTAALLIAVQELNRRDRALESEVADLRRRLEAAESTLYDK